MNAMNSEDPIREARLPKWVQDALLNLRSTVKKQEDELAAIRNAHTVLQSKGWTTVAGFSVDAKYNPQVELYYFIANKAVSLCSIGPDDVLLIGRNRKEWDVEETKRRYALASGDAGVSGKKQDKPL